MISTSGISRAASSAKRRRRVAVIEKFPAATTPLPFSRAAVSILA
jgi:hypothetical protein